MMNGQPVRDFAVMLRMSRLDPPKLREVRDDDGKFGLAAEPGDWHLIIVGHTFARHISVRTVEAGKVLNVGDIHVRRGFTIQGTITDAVGAPVADVEVWIEGSGRRGRRTRSDLSERVDSNFLTSTDRKGYFRLEGVTPLDVYNTTLELSVSKPSVGVEFPQSLPSGDHSLNLSLTPPGNISGTVATPGWARFGLMLFLTQHGTQHRLKADVTGNGSYTLENVPAGTYQMRPFAGSYPPKQVVVVDGQTTNVSFP